MNREQKRKYTKKLKGKGFSETDIKLVLELEDLKNKSLDKEELLEGDKVKLNYELIILHPDYIKNKNSTESHVINYQKFVEDNKDKIMTVKYDKKHMNHPHLVVFEEDQNEDDCKWLWWIGYLQKVKSEY